MRFRFFCNAVLSGFLLFTTTVFAQNISSQNIQQLKVSSLSDQQIIQIWQRFQSSGVSEADAISILTARGLPPTEVEAFKMRLAKIQSGGTTAGPAKQASSKPDSISFKRDTLILKNQLPEIKKETPVYGLDFFSNPALKFEPDIRIATPKGYVLGPDDEIIVILTGLNETTVKTRISPEGKAQVPHAGLIHLSGFTIEQAQSVIRQKMQRAYPALASGQTQLALTLGSVRSIRVTILGEIVKPGAFEISSLSTLFNALYLSGGPTKIGSLRNITINRNNRVLRTVDFYTFLQKGILSGNIRLEDQDVIHIPVYQKRVTIEGEVKRPGIYELKETETLEDLVNYAGGFSDLAYKSVAKVVQIGDKEKSVGDVPSTMFDRYVPHNADKIYFDPILERFSNRVVLEGAVYRPGIFELSPGMTLTQLIKKADGLREDAFLSRGYIKRTRPDMQKLMLSFDLNKLLSGTSEDISLMKEDSVVIVSNTDLRDEPLVSIDGFVRSPGFFTYRKGLKVADLIVMAGGFSYSAAAHRVEISRMVRNEADTVANQLVKTFSLDVDSNLRSNSQDFMLQPMDYVHVPKLVNAHTLGQTTIGGEVLYPGGYSIQRRDETILELIKRAGGLTPYGSLANAQVFRKGVRVDVHLLSRKQKLNGIEIMSGDSIYIPRENLFVEVRGAVNTPQHLRFTNRNFKYYVSSAGGVTEKGNLKRAYIQYPNGINKPVSRFLFFKNYPAVQPGSTIIVPENAQSIKFRLGFGEISGITSALTALVSLVAILSR